MKALQLIRVVVSKATLLTVMSCCLIDSVGHTVHTLLTGGSLSGSHSMSPAATWDTLFSTPIHTLLMGGSMSCPRSMSPLTAVSF